MGYTVYWTQNRAFTTQEWRDIRVACIQMFNRLKQVKGSNGTGRPIIDNSDILFNGDASKGEDHETFQLMKGGSGFNFCKTDRKPYDRYVKAVLVVANYYAPGALEVTCDGDDELDCWTEGVRIATIYVLKTGRSPCSPLDPPIKDTSKSLEVPYKELDDTIKRLEDLATLVDHKPMLFLINYLKANLDDIKDIYNP